MAIPSRNLSLDEHVESAPFAAPAAGRDRFLSDEFRRSYGWLTACMHRLTGSGSDAEDLASSAFTELAAYPDLASIRQPRALLTTIARRLTFEFWRRRDIERAYLQQLAQRPEPVAPSPEALLETMQDLVRIDAALQRLSPKAREAFILSQFEEMKYAEIAARLGVSASMVRKYVAQALLVCCEVA